MKLRKIAVLGTAAMALCFLVGAALYQAHREGPAVSLDTTGQPSIGTGPIEIVVFEDFLCEACRIFSEEVFPKIFSQYIATHRARYTIVPLAFSKESKRVANAALCVYHQNPAQFIPFVEELFDLEQFDREQLLLAAEKMGGIDREQLAQCLDKRLYYPVLKENLRWAEELMGSDFGTPSLFIDGIRTSTKSFDAVAKRIAQIEASR